MAVYDLLIITPEYPPHNVGGGGIAMQQLAYALQKKGKKVLVLSGAYNSSAFSQIQDGDVTVYFYPLRKNRLSLLFLNTKLPFISKYKKDIEKVLDNNTFKSVLCMGAIEFFPIQVAALLRKKKIPYSVDIQGYPSKEQEFSLLGLLFYFFKKLFLKSYFLGAKFLIPKSKNTFNGALGDRQIVIGNGISLTEFHKNSTNVKKNPEDIIAIKAR